MKPPKKKKQKYLTKKEFEEINKQVYNNSSEVWKNSIFTDRPQIKL